MVAVALKKLVEARGVINRTHGGDTYDHHKLRKALRRVNRAVIQEQLDDVVKGTSDDERVAYEAYERREREGNQRAVWAEMDAYEKATGMKFVCEAHYYQHMAYLEWKGDLS